MGQGRHLNSSTLSHAYGNQLVTSYIPGGEIALMQLVMSVSSSAGISQYASLASRGALGFGGGREAGCWELHNGRTSNSTSASTPHLSEGLHFSTTTLFSPLEFVIHSKSNSARLEITSEMGFDDFGWVQL
jgi:hypothetical protein